MAVALATDRFFLVGFMGTGKTTLGRVVADRIGLPFVDLDERIEAASGMKVAEIFAAEGEAGFRRRESEALRGIAQTGEPAVIATGGGAFTIEENRILMKSSGAVIWLDVPLDELLARIGGAERPLWSSPEQVRTLHARREGSYRQAHRRLALGGVGPEEAAERLHLLLLELRKGS